MNILGYFSAGRAIGLLLITFILNLSLSHTVTASTFNNESLHYIISYKWGLIHKDAGTATLSLKNQGNKYHIMLTGKTKPWADKFYKVRDTLNATVVKQGFQPASYVKSAHEGDRYAKDVITYSYSGKQVTAHCKRYREKKGKISTSENTLTSSGPAYDMLSVFYYLRLIDYTKLHDGIVAKVTVFSGSKSELLTIKYIGKEVIKLRDKSKRESYHIKFNFTSGGKKKSSEDIDAWISVDSRHIPLLLIGSLPVGQVKCYYVDS